jgi:peptidoglycan/LPS O-acetylase OafA/YrhL
MHDAACATGTARSGESGWNLAQRRPALPLLTSLRFLAALMVLVQHFYKPGGKDFLSALGASGYDAVTFFFVLSGFILVYVYADLSDERGLNASRRDFWRARFARLAPAFWLSLAFGAPALVYAVFVAQVVPPEVFAAELALVPLLLHTWILPFFQDGLADAGTLWNGPAWSLSVEAFFYAVFPFLIRPFSRLSLSTALVLSLLLVVGGDLLTYAAASATPNSEPWLLARFSPLPNLPKFILGMALGRLFLEGRPFSPALNAALMSVGIAMFVVVLGFKHGATADLSRTFVIAPLCGLIVFSGAGAGVLGEASYALYIIHWPLIPIWRALGERLGIRPESALDAALFFPAMIGLSVLCLYLVEQPARRLLLTRRRRLYALS